MSDAYIIVATCTSICHGNFLAYNCSTAKMQTLIFILRKNNFFIMNVVKKE